MASLEGEYLRISEDDIRGKTIDRIPPSGLLRWDHPSSADEKTHTAYFQQFGLYRVPVLALVSEEPPYLYSTRRNQILATQIALTIPPSERGSIMPTYVTLPLEDPAIFPVKISDQPPVPRHEGDYTQRLMFYRNGQATTPDAFWFYLDVLLRRTNRILNQRGIESFPEIAKR